MTKKQIKAYCKRRAIKARKLVLAAYDRHDPESSIADCIADLMHLCEIEDIDFLERYECARRHFNAELLDGEHG